MQCKVSKPTWDCDIAGQASGCALNQHAIPPIHLIGGGQKNSTCLQAHQLLFKHHLAEAAVQVTQQKDSGSRVIPGSHAFVLMHTCSKKVRMHKDGMGLKSRLQQQGSGGSPVRTRNEVGQVRVVVSEEVCNSAHEPHCVVITVQQPVIVYTLLLKLLVCNKWCHCSSAVKRPVHPSPGLIPNVRVVCPKLIVPLAILSAWLSGR